MKSILIISVISYSLLFSASLYSLTVMTKPINNQSINKNRKKKKPKQSWYIVKQNPLWSLFLLQRKPLYCGKHIYFGVN